MALRRPVVRETPLDGADESCPIPLILALQAAGQDVTAVSEIAPGATDERVLALAADEKRVLITENHDFGEIVFARRQPTEGVVLIRFPATQEAV